MSSPFVSIIINNFKGTTNLDVCLNSIMESDYQNFEVILSDCLTIDIADWVKSNFPQVKLITFSEDIGPCASRNAGLSLSDPSSEYIVFVDNDTKMCPDWLTNLVSYLEQTPNVGAAQPLLLKMNQPDQIESIGGFFNYIGYACLPKFPSMTFFENKESLDICYCEAVTILRRSVLNHFNNPDKPYDADYFQHWEDIDMCWKVMLLGLRVILIPSATVFHKRGVSAGLGKQYAKLVFLNTRNRVTTLLKNYDTLNLIRYFPILVSFEIVKAVALLRENPLHAIATFNGLVWNIVNFKKIWKKRTQTQLNVRRVKDSIIKKVLVTPNIIQLFNDFNRHYA